MAEPTEEQMKELQEKLKNMSPEELKEFQQKQCIFCQIVSGKVSSKKIYEDDICIVILDINPANPGHVLLMPKEHYAIMPMLPENVLSHMAKISKQLSSIMLKALNAEGTTIFIANGVSAGQRAQHFMIHIIPRKENDGVGMDIPAGNFSEAQLLEVGKRIQDKVDSVFDIKREKVIFEDKLTKESKTVKKLKSGSEKIKIPKKDKPADLDDIARLFS